MGRLILRDPAVDGINEIADYIAQDNLDAARRWYDAVQHAMEQLTQMPGMGAMREFEAPSLNGLRSWPVTGFENYLILYLPIRDGIDVIHVLHGARDVERILNEDQP